MKTYATASGSAALTISCDGLLLLLSVVRQTAGERTGIRATLPDHATLVQSDEGGTTRIDIDAARRRVLGSAGECVLEVATAAPLAELRVSASHARIVLSGGQADSFSLNLARGSVKAAGAFRFRTGAINSALADVSFTAPTNFDRLSVDIAAGFIQVRLPESGQTLLRRNGHQSRYGDPAAATVRLAAINTLAAHSKVTTYRDQTGQGGCDESF
ncbi:hypothetical protein [Geomonas agri]|uniref:hypothetical protein n=1 Tax=Geomonas agri TaxID=2873702 RepID=UPI001CD8025C|nr:hypothetical protein [Geomonas agri]